MFYSIVSFLLRVCFRTFFSIELSGLENIPSTGRLILCSNHKTNFDPFFYMAFFPRKTRFMGKETAFQNILVAMFLRGMGAFPVARGKQDGKAIETALDILKNENVLGMFPEGRRIKDDIRVKAKKGIGLLAVTADSPLIPAALISDFRLFSKIRCRIGKPIFVSREKYPEANDSTYYQISNDVLNSIYRLAEDAKALQPVKGKAVEG